MSEYSESDDHGHDAGHGSTALYLSVFVALCALTACSFWTYSPLWPSFLDSKGIKWTFMMAVSVTKALLVITFFMHLKWETGWKWVLTIPASIMSVFLVLMLVPDIGNRWDHASEARQLHGAEPAAVTSEEDHKDHDHPEEHKDH